MTKGPRPVPSTDSHTPSGLPFRVPQASLAPELKSEPTAVAPAPEPPAEESTDDVRSPEEIRKIMGAFQTGSRKGRSAAVRRSDTTQAPASGDEDQ